MQWKEDKELQRICKIQTNTNVTCSRRPWR